MKCGKCRSEIRLQRMCSLISDLHCPQKLLVSSSVRKRVKEIEINENYGFFFFVQLKKMITYVTYNIPLYILELSCE